MWFGRTTVPVLVKYPTEGNDEILYKRSTGGGVNLGRVGIEHSAGKVDWLYGGAGDVIFGELLSDLDDDIPPDSDELQGAPDTVFPLDESGIEPIFIDPNSSP